MNKFKKIGFIAIFIFAICSYLPSCTFHDKLKTIYFGTINPIDSILPQIDSIIPFVCNKIKEMEGNTIYFDKKKIELFNRNQLNQFEEYIKILKKEIKYSNELKYPYLSLDAVYDYVTKQKLLNIGIMYGPKAGSGKEYELIETGNKIIIGKKTNEWRS